MPGAGAVHRIATIFKSEHRDHDFLAVDGSVLPPRRRLIGFVLDSFHMAHSRAVDQ